VEGHRDNFELTARRRRRWLQSRRKPTEKYQFTVMCLDPQDGKTLWQNSRARSPHAGHQQNNTFASGSPITDGKYLLAYFGSQGLHCYDLDGNLKWEKDFGQMQAKMEFRRRRLAHAARRHGDRELG
jgi:outer membrane protein assembly factor BamB